MGEKGPDPELRLIRRAAPLAIPAVVLSSGIAGALAGWGAGASAAIGASLAFANFMVHGFSLARAARISLQVLATVAVVGFVVRLGAIVAIMFGLSRLAWFSILAFGIPVIFATLLLLFYEMKLLSTGFTGELLMRQADSAPGGQVT